KRGRTCSRRTDSAATVETAARGRWRQPLDRVARHRGGAHQRALKARRSPSPRLPGRQRRRRNMIARGRQAGSAPGKAHDSPATRRILPETNRVVENIQGGIAMNRRRFMYSVAAGGAGAALIAARVAALAEADGAATTKRFADQRWALDNIIRANGIDWDQPRSIYLSSPCGVEANADFAAIRSRVQ